MLIIYLYPLQVFRKGSPLVHDMSRAIEKLREERELEKLETEWFHGKSTDTFEDSTNNTPNALSLHDFGGVFLISGLSSTLALIVFLAVVLKKNGHLLVKCICGYIRQQMQNVRKYLFNE